jgi:hypothetical protein
VAAPRQHELELGPLPTDERERFEQPGVVLVRPGARRVEQEGLTWLVTRAEEIVVDAVRGHVNPGRVEAEELDRALPDECARDDRGLCPPGGAVVGHFAQCSLPARKQLGTIEVQDVVQRDGERLSRLRERDRQRIVNGVRAVEPCANPTWTHGRRAHRRKPLRQRPGSAVFGDDLRRKSVPGVGRDGRHEGEVLELTVLRERPRQGPCVGLAASDRARNERQEREPDHAASLLAPCGQKVTLS